jgi:glycosyltransferase involved in cell wall biosynthesis
MIGMPVSRRESSALASGKRVAMRTVSVVVPVKEEQDNVEPLYHQIRDSFRDLFSWEIIYVDDGSIDSTFDVLTRMADIDPRIKVVRLRRNFGQAAAMQAGIDAAIGDVIATIDGDLQNDPADIPRLIEKLDQGYDVVLGERVKRQDALLIRKVPSLIANRLIRRVTGLPFRDFGCTTRVLRSEVARNLRIYGEMHRFIPVLANNLGAKIAQMPVNHRSRQAGVSKYGIGRTRRVLLDLITVRFMSGYITRPMHFMGGIGLSFIGAGAISLLLTGAMKLVGQVDMTGNPFLLLSVLLTLVGIQLISMGLLGEVLTRTYFESQDKRCYVVRDSRNLDEEEDNRVRAA